jgi:hypothetical protein
MDGLAKGHVRRVGSVFFLNRDRKKNGTHQFSSLRFPFAPIPFLPFCREPLERDIPYVVSEGDVLQLGGSLDLSIELKARESGSSSSSSSGSSSSSAAGDW